MSIEMVGDGRYGEQCHDQRCGGGRAIRVHRVSTYDMLLMGNTTLALLAMALLLSHYLLRHYSLSHYLL